MEAKTTYLSNQTGKDNSLLGSDSIVNGTTDRVARSKCWYAVQVRSCCEKKIANKISAMGFETYLPTQEETHVWSDRKKKIQKVLIPLIVFVNTNGKEVKEIEKLSFVYGLLKAPGAKFPAVIPDSQIEKLKFMIGNCDSEITIEPLSVKKGELVRVIRGGLKGLVGNVAQEANGKTKILITIDFLGCASVEIPLTDLEHAS